MLNDDTYAVLDILENVIEYHVPKYGENVLASDTINTIVKLSAISVIKKYGKDHFSPELLKTLNNLYGFKIQE